MQACGINIGYGYVKPKKTKISLEEIMSHEIIR
jgi:hypothetical protein